MIKCFEKGRFSEFFTVSSNGSDIKCLDHVIDLDCVCGLLNEYANMVVMDVIDGFMMCVWIWTSLFCRRSGFAVSVGTETTVVRHLVKSDVVYMLWQWMWNGRHS